TLLDVQIKTGRTHQIRLHLSHIKHPIVGDELYNDGRDKTIADAGLRKAIKNLDRFYLHAEKLSFTHPVTKEKLEFVQPMPDDLIDLLKLL
ncbi:MAG: RluA family pseudouridine synthase, partial [Acidobacteria bacterium]|nr:RluA family pseudouridine synthase [Acidobacteriota bacterium]